MWNFLTTSIVLLIAWTCHCARQGDVLFDAVEETVDNLINDLSVPEEDFDAKYNVVKINDEVKQLNKILQEIKSEETTNVEEEAENVSQSSVPVTADRFKKRMDVGPPKMIFKGKRNIIQNSKKPSYDNIKSKEALVNEKEDLKTSSKNIEVQSNGQQKTIRDFYSSRSNKKAEHNEAPKLFYVRLYTALKNVLSVETRSTDLTTIQHDGSTNIKNVKTEYPADTSDQTFSKDEIPVHAKSTDTRKAQKTRELTNFLISFIKNHKKKAS